jgi:hypothetical protein
VPKANACDSNADHEDERGMGLGNRMSRSFFGSNRDRLECLDEMKSDSPVLAAGEPNDFDFMSTQPDTAQMSSTLFSAGRPGIFDRPGAV